MGRADDSTGLAVLGRPWRRWTAVVQHFARRWGRRRLGPAEYDALYRELLDACRALAGAGDAELQTYARRLEAVVRPWLAVRVLERTDRDILLDLLAQCRQIDRELNGRDWGRVARAWVRPAVAGLAGAVLIALVTFAVCWMSQPLNNWLDREWRAARIAFADASTIERILAAGAALIPIALVWVYHTRKT